MSPVRYMKEIAMTIMNVKVTLFVEKITATKHLHGGGPTVAWNGLPTGAMAGQNLK